jgi:hypothetical protein
MKAGSATKLRITAVLLALGVGACAASADIEKTQKATGYNRQPTRIFFIADIRPQITMVNPEVFANVVQMALQACGRSVMVHVPGRLVIEDSVDQQVDKFAPDAIVTVTILRLQPSLRGEFLGATFLAQMRDMPSKAIAWNAQVYMGANTLGQVGETGTRALASQIIEGLRKDALIPASCSPPNATSQIQKSRNGDSVRG